MQWRFFLLVQLQICMIIAENVNKRCDPSIHRLWYSAPNNRNSFVYCHPVKNIFITEECLLENGIQKEFVPGLQQCILNKSPTTTTKKPPQTTTPLLSADKKSSVRRHPLYSRYGTVAGLKTIDQQLIMTKNKNKSSVLQRPVTKKESIDLFQKCPMNRIALRKENSNEPVECIARPDQDVPGIDECGTNREFTCTFASATSHHGVCCQRTPNANTKCPTQMRPLIDFDGMVRACSPTRIGICRVSGSICVFDENYGDFHCCIPEPPPKQWPGEDKIRATTSTNILLIKQPSSSSALRLRKQPINWVNEGADGCPKGEIAYKNPTTNEILSCNLSSDKNIVTSIICPLRFKCYASQTAKQSQCCGYNNGHCPSNSAALTVKKFGVRSRVVSCGPLAGCPNGYFCNQQTHTCCSMEPISGKCKYGMALAQPDGRAKRCMNSDCPIGYSCSRKYNYSYCCPNPELICKQTVNEGLFCPSVQPKRSYYYHSQTGECRKFMYSGCSDGSLNNQNRFDSQEQCQNYCRLTNICPLGDTPLQRSDGFFVNCTDHLDCPENFNCLTTFRGNYCCKTAESNNVCPINSRPYLLRQKPVECRSNVDCMPTFECIKNESLLIGHCCSKNRESIRIEPKRPLINSNCKNGSPPLRTPDNEIQICIPNKLFECPDSFTCELNGYFGRYQCCNQNLTTESSSKIIECPIGMSLQIHPKTGSVLQCAFDSDCANFAQCQKAHGVCCEANDLKTLLKITRKSQIEPEFLSGFFPGQMGCISDSQCHINFPESKCIDWICHCPNELLAFESTCVKDCPNGYEEQNSICLKV